jgi:hypothetical protein
MRHCAMIISFWCCGLLALAERPVSAEERPDSPRDVCFGSKCVEKDAVKYLGDVCWNTTLGGSALRLGVTHVGGGRFALNGTVTTGSETFPVTGSIMLIVGFWNFTLSSNAGQTGIVISPQLTVDAAGTTLISGTLDRQRLSGTIFATNVIGFSKESPATTSGVTYVGSFPLTYTECGGTQSVSR